MEPSNTYGSVSGGAGEVLPEKLGEGVRPADQKFRCPINDLNVTSKSCFRPAL